ncbi:hypothetical protein [Bradyrhizobium sp. sBnM-33]|uniref:hypothetical protein n=1 Tax=Bradyrhizobium sp. sBnM-33 TaxID=2831780 RepID=UPI001BD1B01E|nr:hypothetical protein [Bradyrhizobium sp. sBnM-33]
MAEFMRDDVMRQAGMDRLAVGAFEIAKVQRAGIAIVKRVVIVASMRQHQQASEARRQGTGRPKAVSSSNTVRTCSIIAQTFTW